MKLKSVELVNALSAAFEQLNVLTQTSVNINQNVVKAEQGNFLLFARFFDNLNIEDGAGTSDGAVLNLGKAFSENPAVGDAAALAFRKSLADIGYLYDSEVIRFVKAALDELAVVDAHALSVSKPLQELVAGVEDHAILLTKKAPDNPIAFSDDSVINFAFNKADAADVADLYEAAVTKPLAEIVAGVGDQTFIFAKKVAENLVGALDNDVISFDKAVTDAWAVSDDSVWALGKALADTPAFTDEINTKDFAKILADVVGVTDDVDGTATILDDQEMQFFKYRTDTAAVSESFDRQVAFVRSFSDLFGATDGIDTIAFGKGSSENLSVAESMNMLTSKQIYDIPVVSDSPAKSVSRPRSDSALIGDAETVAFGKAVQNSASLSDSGSLRSQGYSDFTYFSEDYVGASTTF